VFLFFTSECFIVGKETICRIEDGVMVKWFTVLISRDFMYLFPNAFDEHFGGQMPHVG